MRKKYQSLFFVVSILTVLFLNYTPVLGRSFDISNFRKYSKSWFITITTRPTPTTALLTPTSTNTNNPSTSPTATPAKSPTSTPNNESTGTVTPTGTQTPNDINESIDYLEPSKNPPNGLSTESVPQFIVFGFDDNSSSEGVEEILNLFSKYKNPKGLNNKSTYDDENIKATFYNTLKFVENNEFLKNSWIKAYNVGHEIGNHTYSHSNVNAIPIDEFIQEIKKSEEMLKEIHGDNFKSTGFRTPYLSFNQDALDALKNLGFVYDCSIPEGDQSDVDGKSNYWPYTLDNGSPCNKYANKHWNEPLITGIKGLWEIPSYNHIVPSDEICSNYDILEGLRNRMDSASSDFNETNGKVTGLDWNILEKFKATPKEYSAILKYTLDLRLDGNRAPLTIGMHSNYYTDKDKLYALEDFIKYALSKNDVRIVAANQLVEWMKNPSSIK
jgi:peptidoglycan/xylan/chitin deacetylase (PgdA/CDA1 family)